MFCTPPTDVFKSRIFCLFKIKHFLVYVRYHGLSRLVHIRELESGSKESEIRLKGLCFIRKVCFLPLCKDWKISRLKRDNASQNCEYINIVRILESFLSLLFLLYPMWAILTCIFCFQLTG